MYVFLPWISQFSCTKKPIKSEEKFYIIEYPEINLSILEKFTLTKNGSIIWGIYLSI